MKRIVLFITLLVALVAHSGCKTVPFLKSKNSGVEVVGHKDAGTPATSDTATTKEVIDIPAGSTVTKTATSATPQEPAKEVTAITVATPTQIITNRFSERLSTGTIDTTVAAKRIEVEAASEARRPILYLALVLLAASVALFALLPQWKGLYTASAIGSGVTFLAWKASEVPWYVGLGLVAIIGLIALGYKKGELDKNRDGIPDFLQNLQTASSVSTSTSKKQK